MSSRTFVTLCAAALAMLAVRMGISQTTGPATGPMTFPAPVPQTKAFADLAAKAARIGPIHAVGRWELAVPAREGRKARKDVFAFEVWAAPPRMKAWVDAPSRLTRVSDGKFVYTYAHEPGQAVEARRRALSESNVYQAAGVGGPVLDAAKGYPSLARSARFTPIEEPADCAKDFAGLKWFRLDPLTKPPHHLLVGTSKVIVGISPADGLMRVMVADLANKEQPPDISSVFFEKVEPRQIKPDEMMLPSEAANTQWVDTDNNKEPIPAPTDLIAPKKP
ncbi:MAG TPA: hypothetical protein VM389_06025 [Phycisphaerae bacterium]|nr:hypothetical protein [Phycisphaerae bacterium]HUU22078.1 hypothetical protein [Phycisphaerae bacterium]